MEEATAKIRVLCVDDSEDIAQLLGKCIGAEPDMENAGCLHSADELLAEVERTRADVVILDMKMPGRDPLAALAELAGTVRGGGGAGGDASGGARGGARVIAYSGRDDQPAVDRAVDAGAWGYVPKDAEITRVLEAIREVARGKTAFGVWN